MAITEPDLRRMFPRHSHWWVKLLIALQRDGSVEWPSHLDPIIRRKVWPQLFDGSPQHQGRKGAATIALTHAVRPRRTGKPRGRSPLHLDRVVADIHACFEGKRFYDETRLRAVVLAYFPPMTVGQRAALLRDLHHIVDHQGRRVKWRQWFKKWRYALKKSDAE